MKDISLKELLEAGCHFGHRVDRWHPKAARFIYQARDKVHIIDLAKTRDYLLKAAETMRDFAKEGKTILFIGTKRQAKGVVREAAKRAGIPFMTNRWIGGFMTNWPEVKKNIDKLNNSRKAKEKGDWKQFPKHEIVKLEKALRQWELVYEGVADLKAVPDAVYIIDVRKEDNCLREAVKSGIKVIAIVDTNTDPDDVDYPIPANDDAVGSIQLVTDFLADAYLEGVNLREKEAKPKDSEVKKIPEKGQEKAAEKDKSKKVSRGKKLST